MILRKIRETKQLSQEQLAIMSGLSVRTIQRIESGKRASLDSLKSLASSLETDISTLKQEAFVVDKTTDKWKSLPWIFRMNFIGSELTWLGLSQRKHWLRGEKQVALFGLVLLSFGWLEQGFIVVGLLMICIAYSISLVARHGDRYDIW